MNDPRRTDIPEEELLNRRANGPLAASDLRPFADQLMAIAQHLREADFAPDRNIDEATPREHFADMARQAYNLRRQRSAIFGNPDLFGEPAWDILLDLYIAQVEDKPVSVSSACIGSAAPPTTGLRWLGVLADHGLIIREPDPADHRRVMVRLTERGLEAMDRYFAAATAR